MGTVVVIVIVALLALLGIAFAVSYNRFVRQRNLVRESWRQIDVELQRRHDLIPNLIETVRGYAAQERQVLEAVTQARSQAMQARTSGGAGPAQMAQAENQLQRSLGGLFAVAESYPQLESNQNFLELQRQLADTEDRVAAGRRFYNGNVRALNTRVEAFPSAMVAGAFHFQQEEYFEVDDPQVRGNVRVDFSGIGQDPSQPHPGAIGGVQPGQIQPGQIQPGQVQPGQIQPGQALPLPGQPQGRELPPHPGPPPDGHDQPGS